MMVRKRVDSYYSTDSREDSEVDSFVGGEEADAQYMIEWIHSERGRKILVFDSGLLRAGGGGRISIPTSSWFPSQFHYTVPVEKGSEERT